MKIINADNLGLDYFNESIVAENMSSRMADEIVEFLNNKYTHETSPTCFRVVDDDYVLQTFDEY